MFLKSGFEKKYLKYIMLLPLFLLLAVLIAYPLIQLVKLSFHSGSLGESQSYTLRNFGKMIKDLRFHSSLKTTFIFAAGSVCLQFFIGLGLALLVQKLESTIIRAILLLPMMVAPVAVGLIWRLMYQPMFGIINIFLQFIGLPPQGWLADPGQALIAVIIVDVWQWTPFVYLVLLAGLKSIPRDPYEAARVDGANSWQVFRYVTFPLLKPAIYVALLFRSMDAFKAFDKFVTLTDGGPGQATEILALYIYKVSFQYLEIGYGALLALVSVIFIVVYNESYTRIFRIRRR